MRYVARVTAVFCLVLLIPLVATTAAVAQEESDECGIESAISSVVDSVFQLVVDTDVIGTGFYIGDGEFLTAAHVVVGATEIRAQNGNHLRDLTIVGADPAADFAILSGSGENLEPLEFADSAALGLGERLIVIGYPLFERVGDASATLGVLSSHVDDPDVGYVKYLQTDAAANPGNSGGPVIDICGNVVGIMSSKIAHTAVEGIAYAVAQSSFAEAEIRARNLGPQPPDERIGGWTPYETRAGNDIVFTNAVYHVYADREEDQRRPQLLADCVDREPFVWMWWDVDDLLGDHLSGQVAVSLRVGDGDWRREYWRDVARFENLDDQFAFTSHPELLIEEADDDGYAYMWLVGRNFRPVGMAAFFVGGLEDALDELGC